MNKIFIKKKLIDKKIIKSREQFLKWKFFKKILKSTWQFKKFPKIYVLAFASHHLPPKLVNI